MNGTRAVAFISLIGGNDIYTYGNSHNLIIYFRPDDSKAMAFLWDMDFSFVATINTQLFPGNGNATTYNFITTIPDNYRKFCSHLVDLSSVTGNSGYMGDWATRYASLVGQNWSGAVNYLAQRATYVRSQLPLNTPCHPEQWRHEFFDDQQRGDAYRDCPPDRAKHCYQRRGLSHHLEHAHELVGNSSAHDGDQHAAGAGNRQIGKSAGEPKQLHHRHQHGPGCAWAGGNQ